MEGRENYPPTLYDEIDDLIKGYIPTAPGQSNRLLFQLAQRRIIPKWGTSPAYDNLVTVAERLLERAEGNIDRKQVKTPDDLAAIILDKIGRVESASVIELARMDAATDVEVLPPQFDQVGTSHAKVFRYVKALARRSKNGEFFASHGDATEAIGGEGRGVGGACLNWMLRQKLLAITIPGQQRAGGHATHYRFKRSAMPYVFPQGATTGGAPAFSAEDAPPPTEAPKVPAESVDGSGWNI